ncbi:MAG TPA: 50S ribosomal protein L25/general stress protein Ctc [Oleiagrimonas sp.]|nr:50S ribosomal protein L25/general stress protein Ctc [Oleiagrimonas sp.]
MASTHKITATRRTDEGKGASRRLRRAGQVPAILYGNNIAPLNIQLDHEDILLSAKNEWFFSSVLDLDIEGELQRVLVRDWQVHPYKQQMLHLDFFRIDEKAEIRVNVPLHFSNQEDSPAGKASGVVISHNLTDVEVACLSKDLPEYIDVDLATLEEGQLIHLSDLKLPEGVELVALRQGDEYDQAVVSAHAVKVEAEPAADEAEVAADEVPAAGSDAEADEASKDDDK